MHFEVLLFYCSRKQGALQRRVVASDTTLRPEKKCFLCEMLTSPGRPDLACTCYTMPRIMFSNGKCALDLSFSITNLMNYIIKEKILNTHRVHDTCQTLS